MAATLNCEKIENIDQDDIWSIIGNYFENKHLHQLVFFFIKEKLKLPILLSNNLSSAILLFLNFLIIHICSLNPYSTIYQVKIIACSIILYISGYFLLNKFYKLNFEIKK